MTGHHWRRVKPFPMGSMISLVILAISKLAPPTIPMSFPSTRFAIGGKITVVISMGRQRLFYFYVMEVAAIVHAHTSSNMPCRY